MAQDYSKLPSDLPIPIDDGAGDHLLGKTLPDLTLSSTSSSSRKLINLSDIKNQVVFYCYPLTKQVGFDLPDGWDSIPGARGCTPQSCSFRDHYQELQALNTQVYGISTQTSSIQQETVARLHLPFELLSDARYKLTTALQLPTFKVGDYQKMIKRLTFIAKEGKIIKVFYPVFPPDRNAQDVVEYLKQL